MKTRTLIIFWMVLVLTALVTGGFMYVLLQHEEQRLTLAWQEAAREQGQWLADTISVLVSQAEEDLANTLVQMPMSSLRQSLQDLERENPLVRNVFIVQQQEVVLPDKSDALTAEEQHFLIRYDALFNGTIPWQKPSQDRVAAYAEPKTERRSRRALLQSFSREKNKQRDEELPEGVSTHWIPWFQDEHLYLLGYVMRSDEDVIYGAELEWMALLSRIIPVVQAVDANYVFVLKDGRGDVIHQTGAPEDVDGRVAAAILPIGNELPHWQIEVFEVTRTFVQVKGLSRMLGLIMVLVLMAAIVGCGSLLFWLARRHMLDAQQKTGFVSNVSHELKTPLTTIRMYAEMLGEGRIADEDKKQKYLAVIIEQSQRLTRLVNNVLDFSRLEQKRKKYNLEKIDVVDEVTTILDEQRPRIEQAGMTLQIELPGQPVVRIMDRDVLQQAILNLIDNAMKYAAEGRELSVSWRAQGTLVVCDKGPGIPLAQRENIFQSFKRLDDSLTARQSGCGLGLSIARQLLRDVGGDLFYESRESGGACFVVVIPGEMMS